MKKFSDFNNIQIWNDFIEKFNNGIFSKQKPDIHIIEELSHLIPGKSKILDLSFGDGVNSEYFIEKGYDVYGTDISDLAVKNMKTKYPNNKWILHNTLNDFPFQNNYFNLIFARLSLHYFNKIEIKKILLDIKRIIQKNGVLYIMVKTSENENNTNKKLYPDDEWISMISNHFKIIRYNSEYKKPYTFEKTPSNILEIISINS